MLNFLEILLHRNDMSTVLGIARTRAENSSGVISLAKNHITRNKQKPSPSFFKKIIHFIFAPYSYKGIESNVKVWRSL
jgi:hypothetical protein